MLTVSSFASTSLTGQIATNQSGAYGLIPGETYTVEGVNSQFRLTGTVSVTQNSKDLMGSGTKFKSEVNPGDRLTIGGTDFVVDQVTSDTVLTVSSFASTSLTGQIAQIATNEPVESNEQPC